MDYINYEMCVFSIEALHVPFPDFRKLSFGTTSGISLVVLLSIFLNDAQSIFFISSRTWRVCTVVRVYHQLPTCSQHFFPHLVDQCSLFFYFHHQLGQVMCEEGTLMYHNFVILRYMTLTKNLRAKFRFVLRIEKHENDCMTIVCMWLTYLFISVVYIKLLKLILFYFLTNHELLDLYLLRCPQLRSAKHNITGITQYLRLQRLVTSILRSATFFLLHICDLITIRNIA